MPNDRRTIAWTISKVAKILPAAERQKLREFLFGLPGGEPAKRKRHSWKKGKAGVLTKRVVKPPQKKRPRRERPSPQLNLPMGDE